MRSRPHSPRPPRRTQSRSCFPRWEAECSDLEGLHTPCLPRKGRKGPPRCRRIPPIPLRSTGFPRTQTGQSTDPRWACKSSPNSARPRGSEDRSSRSSPRHILADEGRKPGLRGRTRRSRRRLGRKALRRRLSWRLPHRPRGKAEKSGWPPSTGARQKKEQRSTPYSQSPGPRWREKVQEIAHR